MRKVMDGQIKCKRKKKVEELVKYKMLMQDVMCSTPPPPFSCELHRARSRREQHQTGTSQRATPLQLPDRCVVPM